MGLYGNEGCMYHDSVPNPMYMLTCKHPSIGGYKESRECNQCTLFKKRPYVNMKFGALVKKLDEGQKAEIKIEMVKILKSNEGDNG